MREDNWWYEKAKKISLRSADPRKKVGAVIVWGGRIVGVGVNHLARGTPMLFWKNREQKLKHVVHAEATALLGAGIGLAAGGVLYVNKHPCADCAKLIVDVGINRVVCPAGNDVELSRDILKRGGVKVKYCE